MSRLLSLTITDFKRIRLARILIKDGINEIAGLNGQGKSSVLDAFCSVLSGREIPEHPIRTGSESSTIIAEFSDMIVTRKITASGNTLVVTNKEGTSKFSKPQEFLEKLTGGPGARLMDPSRFIKQSDTPDGRKAQALELKALVGLDTSELDGQRATLFSQRTLANGAADDAEAQYKGLPWNEGAPEAEVSSKDILAEIDEATAKNKVVTDKATEISKLRAEFATATAVITKADEAVKDLEAKLIAAKEAQRRAKLAGMEAEETLQTTEQMRAAMSVIDVAPIRAKLDTLEGDNRKVRENAAKLKAKTAAEQKRNAATGLTTEIDAIDTKKAEMLKAIKYPVEGLSFDDTGVRYNGEPFTQASDAEKLRVAVAIYAARNPTIKAMVLRLGSLMDDASLKLLNELAEKYQLQILLEVVCKNTDEYPEGAIIVEDGGVKDMPSK